MATSFEHYPGFHASRRDQRGAAPLETPPEGAALWTPAKGLRPSRHPFGWVGTWFFLWQGSRRATGAPRREACGLPLRRRGEFRACGRGQGALRSSSLRFRLPPSADSPLARHRPLHSFAAPYRLLRKGACYNITSCIDPALHPAGGEGFQRATAKPFGE